MRIKIISLNIISIIFIAYFSFLAVLDIIVRTPHFVNDFKTFYLTLHEKKDVYKYYESVDVIKITTKNNKSLVETTPPKSLINMNTPFMNIFLKGLLNNSDSLLLQEIIWIFLSLIGAGLSLIVLMKLFNASLAKIHYFFPWLALLWVNLASIYNLSLGQITFFLLPLLCLSYYFCSLKRYTLMTVFFALLASLKLFFLIFLFYYIVKRQRRLGLLFIFLFLIFSFIPMFYFSWQDYQQFFKIVFDSHELLNRATRLSNASIFGTIQKCLWMMKLPIHSLWINQLNLFFTTGVIVAWLIYDFYYLRLLAKYSDEFRFCFLVILALLCSPLAWFYYFIFLIAPFCLLFQINFNYYFTKTLFVLLFVAFLLPCLAWINFDNTTLIYLQAYFLTLSLLIWLLVLHLAAKSVKNNLVMKDRLPSVIISFPIIIFILTILLLGTYSRMPYYLDLDKEKLIKTFPNTIIL